MTLPVTIARMAREQLFDHEEARRLRQAGYSLGGIVRHLEQAGIVVSKQAVWKVVRDEGREATVRVEDTGATVTLDGSGADGTHTLRVARAIAQHLREKGYRVSFVDGRTSPSREQLGSHDQD